MSQVQTTVGFRTVGALKGKVGGSDTLKWKVPFLYGESGLWIGAEHGRCNQREDYGWRTYSSLNCTFPFK